MPCVVFETEGLIDLTSFQVMGVSAKPNSRSPIGHFGTGLKYAVAVVARLGGKMAILVGEDAYYFRTEPIDFRGEKFDQLVMYVNRKGWLRDKEEAIRLPFTLIYGRDWKVWMAFRELEANTRDENGTSYLVSDGFETITRRAGYTRIVVELPEFTTAFEEKEKVFHPDAIKNGDPTEEAVQVIEGTTKAIFYRGLKVYETFKPALFTYNLLDAVSLTEDRTLAYGDYNARQLVAREVQTSNDESFIEAVVTANDSVWEAGLDFNDRVPPSRAFHNVMMRHPKGANASAMGYYARYDERVRPATFDLFAAHPRPWKIDGDAVVDAKGTTIFDCPYQYKGRWDILAGAILKYINPIDEATIEQHQMKSIEGPRETTEPDEEIPY